MFKDMVRVGLIGCLLAAAGGFAAAQDSAVISPSYHPAPGAQAPAPQASVASPDAAQEASEPKEARRWIATGRVFAHLTSRDLGVVINTEDPYSVAVGEYYVRARHIPAEQVLRVTLPRKPRLSQREFERLDQELRAYFGPHVQALALAWTQPYAVNCNSITAAIALGYDDKLCADTCAVSRLSPLFNGRSVHPYSDLQLRLSMLLAAKSVAQAKSMIDRGVAADHSLGLRGMPAVFAHLVTTSDPARSVRSSLFPPDSLPATTGIKLVFDQTDAISNANDVVLYLTGVARVANLDTVHFVPGALADHLTSFGGMLDNALGQMSVLDWIEAGATASYGTVSEPCSYPQKFPHPQVLLLQYLQGATALEAYWKSVAWPQQGVFVGEPLATPFSRR